MVHWKTSPLQIHQLLRKWFNTRFSAIEDVLMVLLTSSIQAWTGTKVEHLLLSHITFYRNNLYLVEWKTSGKPSPAMKNNQKLKDYQLQIAAYVGALNATLFLDDQANFHDWKAGWISLITLWCHFSWTGLWWPPAIKPVRQQRFENLIGKICRTIGISKPETFEAHLIVY